MSYKSRLVGGVFLVRWTAPQAEDVEAITRELEHARARVGRQVDYIAVVPASSPPPDKTTRHAMVKVLERLESVCRKVHMVVEGEGFANSIRRSVLTGILLASRKAELVAIYSSIDQALVQIAEAEDRAFVRSQAVELCA